MDIFLQNYKIKNMFESEEELLEQLIKDIKIFKRIDRLINMHKCGRLINYKLVINYFTVLFLSFDCKFVTQYLEETCKENIEYLNSIYQIFKIDKKPYDIEFYEKLLLHNLYVKHNPVKEECYE